MKYQAVSVIVSLALLAGCAASPSDTQLASAPRTVVQVDGYPIEVAVQPADGTGTLYDVEARAVASASGASGRTDKDAQPLMAQARYRAAALMEMERRYGRGRLEVISEDAVSVPRAMRLRVAVKPK
ncbi:hypothetical protein [Variovorax ginsengisoli]|uniref:Lipoprotein n=1 Tax=Variovorax ginsengisoli TaxID=363844 RepID=A0ABT9S2Q6_9BURK|nr:hypothetical protein [Variovorax ginsengisoli]MDP9898632.1 hypothetical protein [Variovorax ginsengisoli]